MILPRSSPTNNGAIFKVIAAINRHTNAEALFVKYACSVGSSALNISIGKKSMSGRTLEGLLCARWANGLRRNDTNRGSGFG